MGTVVAPPEMMNIAMTATYVARLQATYDEIDRHKQTDFSSHVFLTANQQQRANGNSK